MTPLLTRIEQRLAVCSDPLQEAELLAERACYFARTGNFAGANAIAASLKHAYGDGRNVRISVWIMLIQGLVLYFDRTDSDARDRILRAHLLSDAADLRDLRQLTAAWLAHIEFNRSDFEAMLLLLRKIVQSPGECNNASAIRFNLLVADSYMYCGERQIAGQWYKRARLSAVNDGDQASIAALIYNKAALALAYTRILASLHTPDTSSLRFISLEIESAYSFHVGTEHASLIQLIETCRARSLLMERRFVEARALFESLFSRSQLALGLKSDRVIIEIDYVQCLQELGLEEEAKARFLEIDAEEYQSLTIDDQLVFLVSYISVGRALGLEREITPCLLLVDGISQRYKAGVLSLKAQLDELCAGISVD